MTLSKPYPCPVCHGAGCDNCGDIGELVRFTRKSPYEPIAPIKGTYPTCNVCEGHGHYDCLQCDGKGVHVSMPDNPKQMYGDKKAQLQLCPKAALVHMAAALKEGEKYGPWNWRKTDVEYMTYLGAALRHIYAIVDGGDIDWDSKVGKHHLGGALASLAIAADALEGGFLIDNRPPKPKTIKRPEVNPGEFREIAGISTKRLPQVWPMKFIHKVNEI